MHSSVGCASKLVVIQDHVRRSCQRSPIWIFQHRYVVISLHSHFSFFSSKMKYLCSAACASVMDLLSVVPTGWCIPAKELKELVKRFNSVGLYVLNSSAKIDLYI